MRLLKTAGKPLLAVAALLTLLTGSLGVADLELSALGAAPTGDRLARMKAADNNDGSVFRNQDPSFAMMEPGKLLSTAGDWLRGRAQRSPSSCLFTLTPQLDAPPPDGLRVTWLGHSTLLVELDGATILTDPHWGDRASPFRSMGPLRFHPPPMPLQDLPDLDAVVISHDHYDHLDLSTIRYLAGLDVDFHVPLGVGAHLEAWGVDRDRIIERGWWEGGTIRNGQVELTAVPAQHFSGRSVGDRNRTLWASWVIAGPEHKVFFSGDTGWHEDFAEIGRRYGPFDLTALEVGAFHRSWASVHLGPEAAVRAHQALRGEVMLPIHWATFDLALHGWRDPGDDSRRFADAAGVTLATPALGGSVSPGQIPTDPWWADRD